MKELLQNTWFSKLSTVKRDFTAFFGLGIVLCLFPFYVFPQTEATNENPDQTPITLKVQQLADNLQAPTDITFPGNGDMWVTEQTGKIRVIKNGKLTAVPLLDLSSKLVKIVGGYDERGVLGITLHPKFKLNKKFYVFYSRPSTEKSDHTGVLAEYKFTGGAGQINPNSGRIILTIEEPEPNHNGGDINFGPDGYLYVSFGDGGGQGDKHGEFGNGQKMDTWLGKILRVDINTGSGYLVPKGNPFAGRKNVKPEIWAYGFRNPYRFSFDKATGQMFAGEVGQDLWEEVDIIKKGANYGWRLMEGTHCYNPATGCNTKGITMPITEYSHREGISVIGGYVYNGKQLPVLKSKYIFGDWVGKVFYLKKTGLQWKRGKVTLQDFPDNIKITAFGEDPAGELYILTNKDNGPGSIKGSIYKIVNK